MLLGRYLIYAIYFSKFLQKLRVPVIEAHDFAKLRAVSQFVLYNFAPDLNLSKQEYRAANRIPIFLFGSDHIPK